MNPDPLNQDMRHKEYHFQGSARFLLNVRPIPERQQEAVADDHAQPPQDGQPQADVMEVVVAAR